MEQRRKVMNVLYLGTGEGGERLKKVIQSLVPKEKLEVYGSIEGFSDRLRRPAEDIPVAVIVAANEDDLLSILSISHLLYDVRFILILPDREDGTIAIGHSLRPRFLGYIDSDYRDVTAVLGKMIGGFYWEKRGHGEGNRRFPVTSYSSASYRKVVS
jgi:hypothetical protein